MTQTLPDSGTAILEREELRPDDGDHDRFSHFVPKAKLMEALVNGTPVQALCGKVWIPFHNPDRYPTCPVCQEIWEHMPDGVDKGPDRV
jgi:hypothetical protein